MGKRVSIAIDCQEFGLPGHLHFLPGYDSIETMLAKQSEMVLEFDLNHDSIRGLTYEVRNNKLMIRIFPTQTGITLSAPRAREAHYPYDLIAVVDACDLESLGSIYEEHTEFFYHTPIINIDHQPENEYFGELNLVEMTAVATTEILFSLAEKLASNPLDAPLATCLLAGIIHESRSFQTQNITPHTLAIASELMTMGADRSQIIQNLFYNKPISALQLWGRLLANMETSDKPSMAWAVVTQEDFEHTHTNEHDLVSLLDDLLQHAPQTDVVAILYPSQDAWKAIVHTHKPSIDLRHALGRLEPSGSRKLVTLELMVRSAHEATEIIKQSLLQN